MIARVALLAAITVYGLAISFACAEDPEDFDLFAVPKGDTDVLVRFIEGLKESRPKTSEEFAEHRTRLPIAVRKAAERILQLEGDRPSKAARFATGNLLDLQIQQLQTASADQQAATLKQLEQYLSSAEQLTRDELVLAIRAARGVEQHGPSKLASDAWGTFGAMFVEHSDEQLASYGKKMLGVSRRLDLLGNELQLEGLTLDGKRFDWSEYRGKVVLVDFWATWCPPCLAELPNVKRHFDEYHDRGFDVVAISLDSNRRKLEEFIADRDLPWVTLFEDGVGLDHPLATYYGVTSVPTVMLVNQEGRVVSLDASGPELSRQLASLLGPK